jgi:2-polyprenyl-3-methyl-5-hydroxy-6-metoxy-1,4-benzoquinol methylase
VHSDQELLDLQNTLYTSRNPTRRWLHVSRRDWIEARIRQLGAGCGRALEVGPGSGIYLSVLAEMAENVVAADIEDAYLDQARVIAQSLPGLCCVRDDITSTRLEAGAYDLILCTEVIEHIADSRAAVAGMARLLTPGGTLLLTTPQRYSPLELCAKVAFLPGIIQLVRLVYREPIIETGHINLLTESDLRAQIQAAGLEIIETYKSGFYLPLVAEIGGRAGQRVLQWCESRLRGSVLSGLLWTQYYVLTKGNESGENR